jgi:UPF0755 protein
MRRLGLLVLLAIAAAGGFAAWLDPRINKPYRGYHEKMVYVDIPRGTSRWAAAAILRKNGVVRNRLAFEILSQWHRRYPLQAGEYQFDRPMNARDVFWRMAQGKIFVHTVTVREGWTIFDIADEVDRQGLCRREDFLRAAKDTSLIDDLAPHARDLEGFLFPSTYEFSRHTSPEQIAAAMVRQFRAVWGTIDASGNNVFNNGLNLEQVVAMASLVERETARPTEKPLVASVFYNRLERGSPLQCDPTVQYALVLGGKPVHSVGHADLAVDSPYNTYRHAGLPPGAIANPGELSLRAAVDPAHTDYLFFVADDEGGHFFSRTLAEHNRNIARYRHRLEEDAGSSDPPPTNMRHRRSS